MKLTSALKKIEEMFSEGEIFSVTVCLKQTVTDSGQFLYAVGETDQGVKYADFMTVPE